MSSSSRLFPVLTRAVLGFVALIALASCGDDESSDVVRVTLDPLATSPVSVEGPGGTRLDVPVGAVTTEVEVVMTALRGMRTPPPGNALVATAIQLAPEGTVFTKPVSITFTIEPTLIPGGKTIDDVVVLTAPHGSTVYVPLPTRRGGGSAVVAETTHFSDFLVVVPLLPAPNGMRHVFVTASEHTGFLGGIAGADSLCMGDANRPNSATYKAMLLGNARRACTDPICMVGPDAIDWVFAPMTSYFVGAQGSESLFAITDANAIITNYPLNTSVGTTGVNFWGGFSANRDWLADPAKTCADWSVETSSQVGSLGWDLTLDSAWTAGGDFPCSDRARLVCVEQ